MTIRLRFEELDAEPHEREFPDIDAAVKYAVEWFVGGYEGMYDDAPAQKEWHEASIREHAKRLEDDLRAGHEFYCNRFYERVTFVTSPDGAGPRNA